MLWTVRRIFLGPLSTRYLTLGDARGVELVPLFTLTALMILFGVAPGLLTSVIEPGVIALATRLGSQ
jgi:NADH:ubiquinone oxidoreductase subunit 4 (subunit M)